MQGPWRVWGDAAAASMPGPQNFFTSFRFHRRRVIHRLLWGASRGSPRTWMNNSGNRIRLQICVTPGGDILPFERGEADGDAGEKAAFVEAVGDPGHGIHVAGKFDPLKQSLTPCDISNLG